MKITYSIYQGGIRKGGGFTASKMSEVEDTIKELNSTNIAPKFDYFIVSVSN
jgi:hypothetical protein